MTLTEVPWGASVMFESQTLSTGMRVFTVAWDPMQKKFVARNALSEPLGNTADRANAIGIAIRSAYNASRTGGFIAVKVLLQSGKYRTEYITQPA